MDDAARQACRCWSGALAAIDCEVEDVVERHSHAIVIGRVLDLQISTRTAALAYWQGICRDRSERGCGQAGRGQLPATRARRKTLSGDLEAPFLHAGLAACRLLAACCVGGAARFGLDFIGREPPLKGAVGRPAMS